MTIKMWIRLPERGILELNLGPKNPSSHRTSRMTMIQASMRFLPWNDLPSALVDGYISSDAHVSNDAEPASRGSRTGHDLILCELSPGGIHRTGSVGLRHLGEPPDARGRTEKWRRVSTLRAVEAARRQRRSAPGRGGHGALRLRPGRRSSPARAYAVAEPVVVPTWRRRTGEVDQMVSA